MLKEKPYKGANKLWFHSFMIKSLRLTYLYFIEDTFLNDISISTQYKAYKDEMLLPSLSNIFPYKIFQKMEKTKIRPQFQFMAY